MEDASDDPSLATKMPVPVENGMIPNDIESAKEIDASKLNGDTNSEESDSEPSSGCATPTTNTDSENNLKRKLGGSWHEKDKRLKKLKRTNDFVPPTNPYFSESLFELSQLNQNNSVDAQSNNSIDCPAKIPILQDSGNASKTSEPRTRTKRIAPKKKKAVNQKGSERPQCLELQPSLQFRCSKCGQTGIPSLSLLKEHIKNCTGEPVVNQKSDNSLKKLLVTRRKVYLCSACGSYYENYNLFLHVHNVHRRFVCLYCSAVFSHTEKFLFHLLTKHNCVTKQLNTDKDFFDAHKLPCYLMCCDCEKIFGDGGEHFYGHVCSATKLSKNDSKNKFNSSNKAIGGNQKQINSKTKVKSKGFVEHVTGDTEADILPDEEIAKNLEQPSDSMRESQEEEVEAKSPSHSIAMETEKDTVLVSLETNNKVSEAKLSSCEDSTDRSISNENLDCDGVSELLKFEDDLVNNSGSPEHILETGVNVENESKIEPQEETRKVPKVTLKIQKRHVSVDEEIDGGTEREDSDDSDKLTMELDMKATDCSVGTSEEKENKEPANSLEPYINVAGPDIAVTELELEQPLDKFDIQVLLQKCLELTIPTCIYCNHARKIHVNGKQLGLHAIAEHRFSAVVNSITAEELIPESFVARIKECFPELQDIYFSIETHVRSEAVIPTHVFECFQCRYSTNVHKELYLHNRKMHAKSILLCIMCKSNFYSYSELTCHLCPGLYDQNNDISYRCRICDVDDLPSAFRLMVHLRKRHNACDVCLEVCHNQSLLSNHVWKHKLHHFCYRCGIAYRNKPDITKHLFWKHGTESVLCKKCLQKKWPHVYHFCMPPTTFTCEQCNLNFTKAVALKVHKRLHSNEKPHACAFENCTECFISKKLLLKHEFKHREPTDMLEKGSSAVNHRDADVLPAPVDEKKETESVVKEAKEESKPKHIVDVLDLPALNLSESDSSDSEDEAKDVEKPNSPSIEKDANLPKSDSAMEGSVATSSTAESSVPILENIWDNFKNYQAQKEKPSNADLLEQKEFVDGDIEARTTMVEESIPSVSGSRSIDDKEQKQILLQAIMQDHGYSLTSHDYKDEQYSETFYHMPGGSTDHDYCTPQLKEEPIPERPITPKEEIKKEIPTNVNSDSDSSSCSCGPDCSCSSGSSSSTSDSSDSDSSTSEGRRKQQARREQRKQRSKVKKQSESSNVDVVALPAEANQTILPSVELIIEETDLETTESETDEDFYEKQPQKIANRLLAEKRKELLMLADLGTLVNGTAMESSRPSTPSLPETEVVKEKPKKSKSKKKKRKSKKRGRVVSEVPSTIYQYPTVSPLSISLPKNSPMSISTPALMTPPILSMLTGPDYNSDLSNASDSLRASKRRRIPNRFYGYSSDEEQDKHEKVEKHQPPVLKWRKADLPSPAPPLLVPPITLKAIPQPAVQEPVPVQPSFHHPHPALFKPKVHDTESNDSTSEDEHTMPTMNKPLNQPPLYCYCRCPYDEVSEMIGCDADDCLIEWFHFECVGIMVPPKGQWFCPDCRKKRQQRREFSQL